jgi:hypothetical protein
MPTGVVLVHVSGEILVRTGPAAVYFLQERHHLWVTHNRYDEMY